MASLSLFRYSARLTVFIHNDWVLEITLAFKMVKKVGHLATICENTSTRRESRERELSKWSHSPVWDWLWRTWSNKRVRRNERVILAAILYDPNSFYYFYALSYIWSVRYFTSGTNPLFHLARKEIAWNVFCMVLKRLAFWILSEETSNCYKSFLFVHMYRLKVIKVLHNGCDLYRTLVHSS